MKFRPILGVVLAMSVMATAGVVVAHEGHDEKEKKQEMGAEKAKAKANPLSGAPEVATLGEIAPDFTLTDVEGKEHHLADYIAAGNVVILEWFNPDCPFVKKHHEVTDNMAQTYQNATKNENVVWLAINSGGPGKQGHGVERNQEAHEAFKMAYPVLIDESGTVGKLYAAKTTPHMFVINEHGKIIYMGAIDNAQGGDGKTNYVNDCVNGYFSGKYEPMETKPYGCSVKYAAAS